ncbi:hypothetical protein A4X13_0g9584, partial [Tilletia indica]
PSSTGPASSQVLLYADDIKLQAEGREELRRMLAALEHWCRANGMEINVAKSAELIPYGPRPAGEDRPLECAGKTLPLCWEYNYLGFPHHADGIAFDLRAEANFHRADGMVRYLAVVGETWTPAIRLALYKTLVRPLLDYGGALFWHTVITPPPTSRAQAAVKWLGWRGSHPNHPELTTDQRKARDKLWAKTMRTHHSLATNWIACQRGKENASLPALSSLTGLNHPEHRMYKLAVLLQSHLQNLDPSSIVVARLQELTHFPPEETTWNMALLARAGSEAVLEDLPSASETRTALSMGVRSKVEAHHKLRAYLLLRLKDPANGILPPYIFDSARLPLPDSRPLMTEPRPDRCIFLPDTE